MCPLGVSVNPQGVFVVAMKGSEHERGGSEMVQGLGLDCVKVSGARDRCGVFR